MGGFVPGTTEKLKCCKRFARKIGTTELARVIPMQIRFPVLAKAIIMNGVINYSIMSVGKKA